MVGCVWTAFVAANWTQDHSGHRIRYPLNTRNTAVDVMILVALVTVAGYVHSP